MRYIPGSKFVNRTPRHRKYFKKGIPYILKIIKPIPAEKRLKYIFTDQLTGEDSEIIFEESKQADNFLEQFFVKS